MPDAVIVAAARTPIGRANKGSLIDVRPDDGGVRLSVTDQGIGIPAEELESIFGLFYRSPDRAARDAAGMGLGLPAGLAGGTVVLIVYSTLRLLSAWAREQLRR